MAKPYSGDLRTRVADAIAAGGSSRSIAERFGLAPSTVIKWAKRLRETGSVAPAKFGGHLQCRLDPHRDFVRGQVKAVPHLTLHGLKNQLVERGIIVSHDTVWRFLRREGLSFKKNAAGD
jgi:transposase